MFRYGNNKLHVVTTRFTDETWAANRRWREARGKRGCLYGVPRRPPPSVPLDGVMIVIEMNNEGVGASSNGRIEGLGLCINKPLEAKLVVYGERKFDRVMYAGRYRVDREDIDKNLLETLERLCFDGNCHLKRGSGFTSLPKEWLSKQLARDLRESFRGAHRRFLEHQGGGVGVETIGGP